MKYPKLIEIEVDPTPSYPMVQLVLKSKAGVLMGVIFARLGKEKGENIILETSDLSERILKDMCKQSERGEIVFC